MKMNGNDGRLERYEMGRGSYNKKRSKTRRREWCGLSANARARWLGKCIEVWMADGHVRQIGSTALPMAVENDQSGQSNLVRRTRKLHRSGKVLRICSNCVSIASKTAINLTREGAPARCGCVTSRNLPEESSINSHPRNAGFFQFKKTYDLCNPRSFIQC
jgi:hypothetical protein